MNKLSMSRKCAKIDTRRSTVTTLLLSAVDSASLALANPFAPVDQELAGWFHSHLSHLLCRRRPL